MIHATAAASAPCAEKVPDLPSTNSPSCCARRIPARLALWREACRRLGWNPRDVEFTLAEASDDWDETTRRFQSCQRAARTSKPAPALCRRAAPALSHQRTRTRRPWFDGRAALRSSSKGVVPVREADELVRGTNSSGEARERSAATRTPADSRSRPQPEKQRPRPAGSSSCGNAASCVWLMISPASGTSG